MLIKGNFDINRPIETRKRISIIINDNIIETNVFRVLQIPSKLHWKKAKTDKTTTEYSLSDFVEIMRSIDAINMDCVYARILYNAVLDMIDTGQDRNYYIDATMLTANDIVRLVDLESEGSIYRELLYRSSLIE